MDGSAARPHPDLADLLALIWRRLARAARDRRAAWRHPALASLDAAGAPRVRTLVLRGADPTTPSLTLHTDARSAKAAEIARDPRVALMFWDPAARVQLRIEGRATLAKDGAAFAALPPSATAIYAVTPAPGTPIADPDQVRRGDPAAVFRVITVRPERLEWLDLAGAHRRARFDLVRRSASWLVP